MFLKRSNVGPRSVKGQNVLLSPNQLPRADETGFEPKLGESDYDRMRKVPYQQGLILGTGYKAKIGSDISCMTVISFMTCRFFGRLQSLGFSKHSFKKNLSGGAEVKFSEMLQLLSQRSILHLFASFFFFFACVLLQRLDREALAIERLPFFVSKSVISLKGQFLNYFSTGFPEILLDDIKLMSD